MRSLGGSDESEERGSGRAALFVASLKHKKQSFLLPFISFSAKVGERERERERKEERACVLCFDLVVLLLTHSLTHSLARYPSLLFTACAASVARLFSPL